MNQFQAAKRGHLDWLRNTNWHKHDIDAQNGNGDSALIIASRCGRETIVSLLLSKGASLDIRNCIGQTALMSSIKKNHISIALRLISKESNLDLKDNMGRTALTMTCDKCIYHMDDWYRKRLCKKLLCNGADPNIRGIDNYSALELSLYKLKPRTNVDVAMSLLSGGADPNTKCWYKSPVIIEACQNCQFELAVCILSNGGDPNARDAKGQTAFDVGPLWVIPLILEYGYRLSGANKEYLKLHRPYLNWMTTPRSLKFLIQNRTKVPVHFELLKRRNSHDKETTILVNNSYKK